METTQQISENWRIDVPGEYVRRESDDGFTIFSRGDAEFSTILYGDYPHDNWQAIDAHFGRKGDRDIEPWCPLASKYELDTPPTLMFS